MTVVCVYTWSTATDTDMWTLVIIWKNDIIECNQICRYRTLDATSIRSVGATKVYACMSLCASVSEFSISAYSGTMP